MANITDVPYVVALVLAPGKVHESLTGGIPFCSGSIIHEKWVLTAAHCIISKTPGFMKVVAGCDKRSDVQITNAGGKAGCQARKLSNITKHPKFVEDNPSKYDVALMEVEEPFTFGPTINKIVLWNTDWTIFPKDEPNEYAVIECMAIGWGDIEIGISSDVLREANTSIKHGTDACTCFEMYQQRRMLCSDATKQHGSICPGDSGGPLVCNGTLAGVAHMIYHEEMCTYSVFGPKPKVSCNDPKTVGAWMYVCPMLSFIHDLVPNTPKQPTSCHSPPLINPSLLVTVIPIVTCVQDREETLRIAEEGSEEANIADFPYAVALYLIKQDRKSPICTASILHKNWVLTACHCVDNPGEARYYLVKAGYDKLSQLDDDKIVQTRAALQIQKHPKYQKNKVSKYDVALIKVDDFEFNDRVNRILPYANDWTVLPTVPGKEYRTDICKAVGWGSIELRVPSDSLRYANITVKHGTDACKCFQMYIQRRLLCSEASELKGICPGDSGGPLVCNGSVAGVAHIIYHRDSCKWTYFGQLELKCNSPRVISAWMYVCPMLDFINEHVPDTPKKPKTCQSPPNSRLSTLVAVLSIISCSWSPQRISLNY